MPPILNSLGPITDWLSSRRISSFSTKYDEASRASSAAKVHQHPLECFLQDYIYRAIMS